MSLSLDADQLDRYSRHVIMDEVGPEGQKRLLDGRALVVGAGGLGAPVIQYLAAAGVGTIGIVDGDVVERSNLQRQVIHGDADVGEPKVESAARYVDRLNPDIDVETYETRLDEGNVRDLLAGYDLVVVDCADNFRTRYVVNDAARIEGLPWSTARSRGRRRGPGRRRGTVPGTVGCDDATRRYVVATPDAKFEGQATTLRSDGPRYRCLFRGAGTGDGARRRPACSVCCLGRSGAFGPPRRSNSCSTRVRRSTGACSSTTRWT